MIKSPDDGSTARKRAYWRSRRGMTELEQILLPFVVARFDALSAPLQDCYHELLGQEDWDLFDWLQERAVPPKPFAALVQQIIDHERTRPSAS